MMPIVEPQAKHVYTAKVQIVIDHPDPSRAFQIGTELLQRIGGSYGSTYDAVPYRGPVILQAEVERQEPDAKGGAS